MKRKISFGIGAVALVGAALWMRQIASWRPFTVAKMNFAATQLRFSRDGEWLWVERSHTGDGLAIGIENGALDSGFQSLRQFQAAHQSETFPRATFGRGMKLLFLPTPRQVVSLQNVLEDEPARMLFEQGRRSPRLAWSKPHGEVYGQAGGNLYIWDWTSGKLKKELRYVEASDENAVFSPDAKWLLTYQTFSAQQMLLRRYEVQSGKLMEKLNRNTPTLQFGFSPDGKWLWFVRADVFGRPVSFHALPIANAAARSSQAWSLSCFGPVKWLPDGRIGIIRDESFEWRSASGGLLRALPGPLQNQSDATRFLVDWTLSPDGNSIYSCERGGTVRRWRAR